MARSGHSVNVVPRRGSPGELAPVDVSTWGATLVSRSVADAGVLPDPELFFGFEDFDFFCRAREAGFAVLVDVPCARKVAHRQTLASRDTALRDHRPIDSDEPWRAYYFARNFFALARRHGRRSWYAWHLLYSARRLQLATSGAERRAILEGLGDGVRGRLGINTRYLRRVGERPVPPVRPPGPTPPGPTRPATTPEGPRRSPQPTGPWPGRGAGRTVGRGHGPVTQRAAGTRPVPGGHRHADGATRRRDRGGQRQRSSRARRRPGGGPGAGAGSGRALRAQSRARRGLGHRLRGVSEELLRLRLGVRRRHRGRPRLPGGPPGRGEHGPQAGVLLPSFDPTRRDRGGVGIVVRVRRLGPHRRAGRRADGRALLVGRGQRVLPLAHPPSRLPAQDRGRRRGATRCRAPDATGAAVEVLLRGPEHAVPPPARHAPGGVVPAQHHQVGGRILLRERGRRLRCLSTVARGLADGARGRLGIRFPIEPMQEQPGSGVSPAGVR